MPSRNDVVTEARKWLGTPWVHQGRARAGIDCAGLLIVTMQGLGLPVEDMHGYRRSPDGRAFREHIMRQTDLALTPQPGTIALFREAQFPTHTGFFAIRDGKLTLIHAYMPAGKVVEEIYDHEWPERLVAMRDIRGLED